MALVVVSAAALSKRSLKAVKIGTFAYRQKNFDVSISNLGEVSICKS